MEAVRFREDGEWTRSSFMQYKSTKESYLKNNSPRLNENFTFLMNSSPDLWKFSDTAFGGSPYINPPAQANERTDPRLPRILDMDVGYSGDPYPLSLGHWYSENIEDNATCIHMRFGIPAFNSLFSFFGNFYSADQGRWVNKGRGNGIGNFIGKALGWGFSLGLAPFIMAGSAWDFYIKTTSTRFMYLKPMMGTYWKYVNDLCNQIGANMEFSSTNATKQYMGVVNAVGKLEDEKGLDGGGDANNQNYNQAKEAFQSNFSTAKMREQVALYNRFLPDIYTSRSDDGTMLTGINVYAVSTRYARKAYIHENRMNNWMAQVAANPDLTFGDVLRQYYVANTTMMNRSVNEPNGYKHTVDWQALKGGKRLEYYDTAESFLEAYSKTSWGKSDFKAPPPGDPASNTTSADWGNSAQGYVSTLKNSDGTELTPEQQEIAKKAASADGTPQYESFTQLWKSSQQSSNGTNVAPNGASGGINPNATAAEDNKEVMSTGATLAALNRDGAGWLSFRIPNKDSVSESFSNTLKDSGLADKINSTSSSARDFRYSVAGGNLMDIPVLGSILGFVGDIATGFIDSIGLSGLAALGGSALADINKHYSGSDATFNEFSFDIELRAPYGNDLSRWQCEIFPLICALAAALPRSTGAQSYSGPFYCEWYCKGRGQDRMSIIESLGVERAVANAPWTQNDVYRGINLGIKLRTTSTIMHMNLNEVSGWSAIDPTKWNRLIFPTDSVISDYQATLACLGLTEQLYRSDKQSRAWSAAKASFKDWWSADARANAVYDGQRGQLLKMFSRMNNFEKR